TAAAADDHFLPEGMTLEEYEQSIIREALKRANGNKSQAARLLGLTRNALRYRLTQMGLEEGGSGPTQHSLPAPPVRAGEDIERLKLLPPALRPGLAERANALAGARRLDCSRRLLQAPLRRESGPTLRELSRAWRTCPDLRS